MKYIDEAKRVLQEEADAILRLKNSLGSNFEQAVEAIYNSKSYIIISGIGKSGIIGKKIASTFSSTGTAAIFVHAAEAIHGDLGILPQGGVCILISYSGNTKDVIELIPVIKRMGCKVIAMTANTQSELAKHSDLVLDIHVDKEACPLNLAPTTSTTATLALGDALSVALLVKRGFKKEDFALFHPGGMLGKMLLLKVHDVMRTGNAIPLVYEDAAVKEGIIEIMNKRIGMTLVASKNGEVTGIITDGDLRRGMAKGAELFTLVCKDIMTKNPQCISEGELAATALRQMKEKKITTLVVKQDAKTSSVVKTIGVVTMHDLLERGLK